MSLNKAVPDWYEVNSILRGVMELSLTTLRCSWEGRHFLADDAGPLLFPRSKFNEPPR